MNEEDKLYEVEKLIHKALQHTNEDYVCCPDKLKSLKAQIIGLLKSKSPHPCNYINLRQAEIEKQLRLAETIRQAHSPDCQEQPSELVAELRDWVEYRADTHEEKAILNKAADRIEELTKKVLFERSWGKQYYEKCNRLNERVAQLEAFALKLVDGDRDELLNLDYWAEEYLHAYNQLCGVNEMQNKIKQLEAEIKELRVRDGKETNF